MHDARKQAHSRRAPSLDRTDESSRAAAAAAGEELLLTVCIYPEGSLEGYLHMRRAYSMDWHGRVISRVETMRGSYGA